MGNTNILIVSHASLCEGLVDAFHMLISSKEETISAVSLTDAGVEDFRHRLSKRVEALLNCLPILGLVKETRVGRHSHVRPQAQTR